MFSATKAVGDLVSASYSISEFVQCKFSKLFRTVEKSKHEIESFHFFARKITQTFSWLTIEGTFFLPIARKKSPYHILYT